MQRGFTAKTSPINAAIVTTEGINEAKDNGKTVSITTLDAEKAFDKLVHNILPGILGSFSFFRTGVSNPVFSTSGML
jgi:hypothetical protein